MSLIKSLCIQGAVIFLLLLAVGCTTQDVNPVEPVIEKAPPLGNAGENHGRHLWGVWSFICDADVMTVTAEPSREALAHYNITGALIPPACDDCLQVVVNSFDTQTRIMDVDVTLRNPFHISGRDVRGILFTNEYGHELLNADDWTPLWDIPGAFAKNPFKAFAKDEPNRIFAGMSKHTENYSIYIPEPPSFFAIQYAVDASWPDNCQEPYAIENFAQLGELKDIHGDTCEVEVEVYDWQDDVSKVYLQAEAITGLLFLELTKVTDTLWRGEVENYCGAGGGEYRVFVAAKSADSGTLYLYDYTTINITSSNVPDNPVDLTPPYLNFGPDDVCFYEDYALVAAGAYGLHIFDITDTSNPVWIKVVEVPHHNFGIAASDGYAYVTGSTGYLHIIDIDPIETAYVVKTVPTINTWDVCLYGEYAFVGGIYSDHAIDVVDIDPVEDAHVVATIDTPCQICDIDIENGYLYVAGAYGEFVIIDIDPLGSASEVISLESEYTVVSVDVVGDYAYIIDAILGIRIIDINPPAEAHFVRTIDQTYGATDVSVLGNYAYISHKYDGLQIADINPPEAAVIIKTVEVWGDAAALDLREGLVLLGDKASGIALIDVEPIESAFIEGSLLTPGRAWDTAYFDGYAYVADSMGGLQVYNVDPPGYVHFVTQPLPGDYTFGVDYSDGYVYIGGNNGGLKIFKANPPDECSLVKVVDSFYRGKGVCVDGDYAYVVDADYDTHGLRIFDISIPEQAIEVQHIITDNFPEAVAVQDGYAYVGEFSNGVVIIDVDPVDSAYVVKTVHTGPYVRGIDVADGYAFVANDANGLRIVDVDPPGLAHIVNTVDLYGSMYDVEVSDGYAYVANHSNGLNIVDISPVETAHLFKLVHVPNGGWGLTKDENMIYICGLLRGLHIIQLW